MLDRNLKKNSTLSSIESDSTEPVEGSTPSASKAIERPQDTLAGAFPAWDLLPPDTFVKRISRKPKGEKARL